jgi:hypothetical protein
MTKSDHTLALIATQFARHDVEKSGAGYTVAGPPPNRLEALPEADVRFAIPAGSVIELKWCTNRACRRPHSV